MKRLCFLSFAFVLASCNQGVKSPLPDTASAASLPKAAATSPARGAIATQDGQTTCADVYADMLARGVPKVVPATEMTPSELAESLPFNVTQRVADGDVASRAESKGVVGVGQSRLRATCTGTLIDSRWVLTAAHCGMRLKEVGDTVTYTGGATEGWVFIGSTTKSIDASGAARRGTFLCHPGFQTNLQNDLALIRLDEPVKDEPVVSLPTRSDRPMARREVGMPMMVFGFGATDYDPNAEEDKKSGVLRSGIVALALPRCGNQPSKTFCSLTVGENAAPHVGLCRGDSGGPLFIDADGSGALRQFGVNSFMNGGKCGDPKVTSGFVDVSRHLDWIAKVTGLPF